LGLSAIIGFNSNSVGFERDGLESNKQIAFGTFKHWNFLETSSRNSFNDLDIQREVTENTFGVFELKLPDELILEPGLNNQPIIHWEFTHNDLYFPRISGAIRLSNGNTLICEGDYGFWEVTPEKDIVWKYNGQGQTFWRAYPAYNYVE
ncbi:hypothetical protein N8377_02780, partial [Flavobacteriaceae bacterium]|nr:hypothetical protein [Flavobacteriaceae bacterium]